MQDMECRRVGGAACSGATRIVARVRVGNLVGRSSFKSKALSASSNRRSDSSNTLSECLIKGGVFLPLAK